MAYLRGENWTDMPKFGFDSGKGHLRMTLSLLETSISSSHEAQENQRVKRSDKIEGAAAEYSVTGRKKVQIVASASQVTIFPRSIISGYIKQK